MSSESGIATFRDSGGLWENYDVMEVASHDGYLRNPRLIHDFYNMRRKELVGAKPNAGHLGLVDLERDYDVYVITQNVDNLHERAGSSKVLHLHGELMKVRAVDDESKVWELHPDALETTPDTIIDGNGAISRVHAIIYQRDDGCYLKDNKATNATLVDGVKLEEGQEVKLKNDAMITIGGEDFIFKLS